MAKYDEEVKQIRYGDFVQFPPLIEATGSLYPLEKSLLGHFILLTRPENLVEIGVFRGRTSEFICDFLKANQLPGKLYGFDYPDIITDLRADRSTIRAMEEDGQLQLIPGILPDSLKNWLATLSGSIDLALVDATHTYDSVISELNLLWPHLSDDGYILCHDYSKMFDGVRRAVEEFATSKQIKSFPLLCSGRAREQGYSSSLALLSKIPLSGAS